MGGGHAAAPPHATRGGRLSCSADRAFLAVLALLLIALVNVAFVADVLAVPSTLRAVSTPGDGDNHETAAIQDRAEPSRRAVRIGMQMPARGPPRYRPGCDFMAKHHLEDRFVRDDACYSRAQMVAIIQTLVVHAAQIFAAHNITYFLESGSLLGAYRNQGVIPHDFDGDLAIDAAGFEFLRTQRLPFDERLYQMDVWNSPHYENAGRDDKLSARLIHKDSALYVDVFVFRDRWDPRTKRAMVGPAPSDCYSNCVKCPRLQDGRAQLLVPREWVHPLQDCLFGGHTLKCPARIVEYLTHEYGDNFMDPA